MVEHVLGIGPDSTKKLDDKLLTEFMAGLPDQETREELLARVETPKMEEANGAMRRHEDMTWIWMVELYSRSVTMTVFDRGKSPREGTGGSPQEAFDMTKHGTCMKWGNRRLLRPIAALLGGEKDSGVVGQTFPYDTG